MKIGIIGAGAIGAGIARNLAPAGHEITIADAKGREAAGEAVAGSNVTAVELDAIVSDVDVIVVSVPTIAISDLADLLARAPAGVTVIDTSNYYPFRDGTIEALVDGTPESVWVGKTLSRPVVKAFNAALAHTQATKGRPSGSAGRIAIPVAGDDDAAKRVAMNLVDDAGFDPVDAGTLAESWRQQPGTPAYCTELEADRLREALGAADKDKAPVNRDNLIRQFFAGGDSLTHEDIVEMNRAGTTG